MDSQGFRNRKLGCTCVRARNPIPGRSEVWVWMHWSEGWVWMHFSMWSASLWVCDHPDRGQPQGGEVLGSKRKEHTTELSATGGSVGRRGTSTPRIHDKGATGDQSKGCCNARQTGLEGQARGQRGHGTMCKDSALQKVAVQGGAEGSFKIQTDQGWLSDKERIQPQEKSGIRTSKKGWSAAAFFRP